MKRFFKKIWLVFIGAILGMVIACFRIAWLFTFSKDRKENTAWFRDWLDLCEENW